MSLQYRSLIVILACLEILHANIRTDRRGEANRLIFFATFPYKAV